MTFISWICNLRVVHAIQVAYHGKICLVLNLCYYGYITHFYCKIA